ncbi:MAG: RNA polymerase sigma factor [Phycisphaerae bacterium]|nr:RNA polymerase sigma factor [Phycisphaerae bacterium]
MEIRTHIGLSDAASKDWDEVQQICSGDTQAYQHLVDRHQRQVTRLMWRFSRDPVVHEELVQDVFVEAYLHLRGYQGKAPFEHWLSRIAVRVGYRFWKQEARYRKEKSLTAEHWSQIAEADFNIDAFDAGELLHRLLSQLPSRDRLVLTFRYIEELDVAQTAKKIGWSEAMVKVQSLRAKKKLEKLVKSGLERTL